MYVNVSRCSSGRKRLVIGLPFLIVPVKATRRHGASLGVCAAVSGQGLCLSGFWVVGRVLMRLAYTNPLHFLGATWALAGRTTSAQGDTHSARR
jgi:hypothetical protein